MSHNWNLFHAKFNTLKFREMLKVGRPTWLSMCVRNINLVKDIHPALQIGVDHFLVVTSPSTILLYICISSFLKLQYNNKDFQMDDKKRKMSTNKEPDP